MSLVPFVTESSQTPNIGALAVGARLYSGASIKIRGRSPAARAAPEEVPHVKNARLRVVKGVPHGLCTTHKDLVNEELISFIKN